MPRSRPRKARGQSRPQYLESADLDRVFIMLMTLCTDVSALRDRIDTHEALAERGDVATTEAVENYELDPARHREREARREAFLDRILRVLVEERDSHGQQGAAPAGPAESIQE
jgi:hypothetical protein